ncbi:MAG: hypothetical protein CSA55_03245 [Ilumatobacter coccineus]|uniref:RadC-like JAB domain-containing protein n=1 Tax=Ilumatobacter coccineus TaxID=467094 RepID=A0A2G6KC05_9ACTN|nr:MAG: hypothetical protein CSA55_03245 [Ilumatobacter coccineus]
MVPAFCRVPQAAVDRIDTPRVAWAACALARSVPPRSETIILFLDHDRRGRGLAVVSGTREPSDVVDVAEFAIHSVVASDELDALVIASVRPSGEILGDDIDRWLEMSHVADAHGVTLVEWFVAGESVWCPRDLLGERPRW